MYYENDSTKLEKKGKEPLFIYTNGISLWIDFDMETGKQTCEVRLEDEVLKKFDKISLGEAFIDGMKTYTARQGDIFVPKEGKKLPENIEVLQKELRRVTKERDQAQKLAEKLVKGVMKNKVTETEESIQKVLEKHVNEL